MSIIKLKKLIFFVKYINFINIRTSEASGNLFSYFFLTSIIVLIPF